MKTKNLLFVLVMFLTHNLRSQECYPEPPAPEYLNHDMDGAFSGSMSDSLIINIYLQFIRLDNGTGGLTNSTLINIMKDNLDSYYEPLDIYFNYIECDREVHCSSCQTNSNTMLTYINANNTNIENGINIYISNVPGGFSRAYDYPSTSIFYRYPGSATLLAHEVGHALGLLHTYHYEIDPDPECTEEHAPYMSGGNLIEGSNCETAGDLLCDTPADPDAKLCFSYNSSCSFVNPTAVTDSVGNPYIDPNNVLVENIMSTHSSCRFDFTDDQHHRMRDMIFHAPELSNILNDEIIVNTNTTWDTDRDIPTNVRVEPGVTLTIESTIKFSAGTGIILEPGALISLDGATLGLSDYVSCTVSSADLWNGIKLERTSTVAPEVSMYQSTIKNADKALFYDGAGIVDYFFINETDFINNRISFENNSSNDDGSGPIFRNCNFIIDDNYLLSDIEEQVVLINSFTTAFYGCDFDVQSSVSLSDTRSAISSYNSQFFVHKWSSNKSNFINWTTAIESYNGTDTYFTRVRDSEFEENHNSIVIDNTNAAPIYRNDIDISDNFSTSAVYYGIKMDNADGLDVYENNIYSNTSGYNRYGIYSDDTGDENLSIQDNTITNMTKGIFLENSGTASDGLTLLCNDQSGNDQYDVHANNGIGPVHGSSGDPAGNTFSGVGGNSDFYVQSTGYSPTYHYYSLSGVQNPVYSSGVTKSPTTSSPACTPGVNLRNTLITRSLEDFWNNNQDLKNLIDVKREKQDKLYKNTPEYKETNNEIYLLKVAKNRNINKAIVYVLDQEKVDYDELRNWLSEKNTYQADLSIVKTYVTQRNYEEALGKINSLISKRQLSKNERLDWNQYKSYLQLLVKVYKSNRHEGELTEAELNQIVSIAYNNTPGPTRKEARTLLKYFYDYDFDQEYENLDNYFFRNTTDISEEVIIHPNPSSNIINIISKNDPLEINIFSLDGKLIHLVRNIANEIDVSSLESGLYIYKISLENGEVSTGKFIKQ